MHYLIAPWSEFRAARAIDRAYTFESASFIASALHRITGSPIVVWLRSDEGKNVRALAHGGRLFKVIPCKCGAVLGCSACKGFGVREALS